MTDNSPYRLDQAIALTQTGSSAWRRETPDDAWNITNTFMNGGYLNILAANASVLASGGQLEPVAISTTFIQPAALTPIDIEVATLNAGRSVTTTQVTLSQDGLPKVSSLVTLGRLPAAFSGEIRHRMPEVVGPTGCTDLAADREGPAMSRVMDMRFVPGYDGWLRGNVSKGAQMMAWVRFRDERPLDPLAIVALADMGPPVAFAQRRMGWAPTLQLMVGNFVMPQGDWLLMHMYGSPYGDGPYGCEDVDMWDHTGQLVARARQVAMPPKPRTKDDGKSGH